MKPELETVKKLAEENEYKTVPVSAEILSDVYKADSKRLQKSPI